MLITLNFVVDAACKFPSKEELMEAKETIISQVLEKMTLTPPVGKWGEDLNVFLKKLCEHICDPRYEFFFGLYSKFVDILDTKKFCLPSVLYKSLLELVDDILSDMSIRLSVRENFKETDPLIEEPCIDTFFVEFAFTLSDKLLHLIKEAIVN